MKRSLDELILRIGVRGVIKRKSKTGTVTLYWRASSLSKNTIGFDPLLYRLYSGTQDLPGVELERVRREAKQMTDAFEEWVLGGRQYKSTKLKSRKRRPAKGGQRLAQASQKIYFASVGDIVKIGLSSDIEGRMSTLRCAAPALRLAGVIDGGRAVEKFLHDKFKHLGIGGEWFRNVDALKEAVDAVSEGALAEAIAPRALVLQHARKGNGLKKRRLWFRRKKGE